MQPVIESRALSKIYGVTHALRGVDLSVQKGEIFGFLGPNGAGKTTFVKTMLDFIRPTGGMITILGMTPRHLDRSRIGYLPERVSIHPFLSAREFLHIQGKLAGLKKDAVKSEVVRALDRVKMSDRADERVSTFSKGMIQRIGIAQALLGQPEVLILDEPNSGLDPIGMLEMREIIQAERDRGATVFLNSHQLLEVEKTCDRMAILHKGAIVAQGRREELGARQGIEGEVEAMTPGIQEVLRAVDPKADIQATRFTIVTTDKEKERTLPARIVEKGGRLISYQQRREGIEELFKRLVIETGTAGEN